MKRVVLGCDRCGKEEVSVDGKTQMQLWGVQPVLYYPGGGGSTAPSSLRQDWCRECVIEVGVLTQSEDARAKELSDMGKKITPPPTFEEIVREMLRVIVVEEIDAQK